jgi:D-arabinose 1-dehydrogenase-like Zn-dependent alcohol dehydrogenase
MQQASHALRAFDALCQQSISFMYSSGSDIAQAAELSEQGKPKVIIDKTYPFANISEALAYVENGIAEWNVVVTMGW